MAGQAEERQEYVRHIDNWVESADEKSDSDDYEIKFNK